MSTPPLLYRPRLAGSRHVIAACRDIDRPCWHAECGICRRVPAAGEWLQLRPRTSGEATAWLAQHLRDEHGVAL